MAGTIEELILHYITVSCKRNYDSQIMKYGCPNDYMLYYKETEKEIECTVCGASRYKAGTKTPAKILRHFPLKPRLQRLYMCPESAGAEGMTWHEEGRTRDGVLRHPADSEAWKDFDARNPSFAAEPRNIRLGLASDGFSPYHSMRNPHSTWPVVLLPYKLPPWLRMKQPNIILSLLIPGPHSPVSAVMGDDTRGRVRCLGNTVKPKDYWGEEPSTSKAARLQIENDQLKRELAEKDKRILELETQVGTMQSVWDLLMDMEGNCTKNLVEASNDDYESGEESSDSEESYESDHN